MNVERIKEDKVDYFEIYNGKLRILKGLLSADEDIGSCETVGTWMELFSDWNTLKNR
jgi:hypothetical protein